MPTIGRARATPLSDPSAAAPPKGRTLPPTELARTVGGADENCGATGAESPGGAPTSAAETVPADPDWAATAGVAPSSAPATIPPATTTPQQSPPPRPMLTDSCPVLSVDSNHRRS